MVRGTLLLHGRKLRFYAQKAATMRSRRNRRTDLDVIDAQNYESITALLLINHFYHDVAKIFSCSTLRLALMHA